MLYFWKALGTRTTVALLPDVTHTNTGRQRQIQERKQRNFEIGQVCPYTLDGASWISSGPSIGPYCPYTLKTIAVFLWPPRARDYTYRFMSGICIATLLVQ